MSKAKFDEESIKEMSNWIFDSLCTDDETADRPSEIENIMADLEYLWDNIIARRTLRENGRYYAECMSCY